jgi:ribosome-binding protein aMBF1 (putative translation factor)
VSRTSPRHLKPTLEISTWADLVRHARYTYQWSQRRAAQEFGVRELAVRNWENKGSLPYCDLIARHMAKLVKILNGEEILALAKGAYLDPPRKVPSKKGREAEGEKA